jgi:hypothetical protein
VHVTVVKLRLASLLLTLGLLLSVQLVHAGTVQNVTGEGACAIMGMSAEQCALIALRRARASAIEKAAGVTVTSASLVTNMAVTIDFIKTYAKGFIVKERVTYLPLTQYQKDEKTPPIPEYRVRIVADVSVPAMKIQPLGLLTKINSLSYRNGEQAAVEVRTSRPARVAIFNITADDRVALIFPNEHEKENGVSGNKPLLFPRKQSRVELVMQTLPGHKRDTEAFFVAAADEARPVDFMHLFSSTPIPLTTFFQQYARIVDYCEDAILPYEVVAPE